MKRHWFSVAALAMVLIGGIVAAWYFWPPAKFDFDQLGGTLLVYEIAANQEEKEGAFDPDKDMAILTESLQRRLDPDHRDEVTVRSPGKGRVEIRIARGKDDHAAKIKQVKSLLSKPGRLEFRILANRHDDKEAIEQARKMLNARDDPLVAKDLEDRQRRGLPPPGPRAPGDEKAQVFVINLAGKAKSSVTYNWVELGPHECQALNLDPEAEHDPKRNAAWLEAKKHRGQATTLTPATGPSEWPLLQGALFFSRECKDRNLPEVERQKKAVEYFVLARDPEFDQKNPELRTPRIDGSFLASASRVKGFGDRPAVSFTFNTAGGEWFGALTRKNVAETGGPDRDTHMRRHLAVILDGLVLSAPTINSEIRTHGQISGNFSQQEVDEMVNILRGGALPARLKPAPVSETEVAPRKGTP